MMTGHHLPVAPDRQPVKRNEQGVSEKPVAEPPLGRHTQKLVIFLLLTN